MIRSRFPAAALAFIAAASIAFADDARPLQGSGNTSLENDLALVVSISNKLALSAGFTFQKNTQPPAGLKKINTLTTLNLVYAFNQ
jgi:putative salt-induced outer membrane protein YdiY